MARVNHRSGAYGIAGGSTTPDSPNGRSFRWPAVMPHTPGMQPPPNDPRKLRRELCRLNWALHCILGSRAQLVILLDHKDRQVAQMRRERDAYANALEALDADLFALCEQERRDYDDPIKALKWAQRRDGGDGA